MNRDMLFIRLVELPPTLLSTLLSTALQKPKNAFFTIFIIFSIYLECTGRNSQFMARNVTDDVMMTS